MPSSSTFPLRWESTGDQWWYASPIDCAAANGHYDLVRQLIRIDPNHLISLTSIRRIRRLETLWDDESQNDDVAKRRSEIAKQLFAECENRKGENTFIGSGYGGWLLYTAVYAGDLEFVRSLLERDPLLVFGEGEYGVTDMLYAAARSDRCEVFWMILDHAASPRFSNRKGKELEEQIGGDVPHVFKQELMNRALHAVAKGGSLKILETLLGDCSDVLVYRDIHGSTILHTAARSGHVEVVRNLIASFDVINSVDDEGNTALHIAGFRGQLGVVEALIHASPSIINVTNNGGDTILHMVVSGFGTPGFRRLDQQVEFMKELLRGRIFDVEDIINFKNNEGKTALHMAIIGKFDSDLIKHLMMVQSLDINIRDTNGMTPLDMLRQRRVSESSETLMSQLKSSGDVLGCGFTPTKRAILSKQKKKSIVSSPGTSFRVSDAEILLYKRNENVSDHKSRRQFCIPTKPVKMPQGIPRLKSLFPWPRITRKRPENFRDLFNCSQEIPAPLRQRFAPYSTNKRVRASTINSNQHATGSQRTRSCSFSMPTKKQKSTFLFW